MKPRAAVRKMTAAQTLAAPDFSTVDRAASFAKVDAHKKTLTAQRGSEAGTMTQVDGFNREIRLMPAFRRRARTKDHTRDDRLNAHSRYDRTD
jgi:hypothetical protein